ncbi:MULTISPECIES: HAD family hydrolase [unclassified Oceanispirochaeta]|uniref:HAD family hydrolase n=1 Tax=unclassified Oceanispirochaeta TaxID=2635722 RepID=UPI001314B091|nr:MULTISPECIES: HAD-IA family hydrolase [unclassified Oceanispirochaeta]MBF9018595.1 HAD-IA family hydrolase [Oceanispirochaeta sp. M2]NPD75046.1 HAD-IA family hydrolase [Oceanispirochaeta sp. M1]
MKKYKAVLFDLFTTLTSLKHLKDAPGRFTYEILGVPPEAWSNALFHKSRQRLIGAITDPIEIIKDVAWKIDPWIPEDVLKEAVDERRIRFRYCLENPPEGVVDSLRGIRKAGYKTALVSNADVIEIEAWKGSELDSCFDEIIFSCHEGFMKPDPEIFALAAERVGVDAEDCLYVGDGGNQELIASAEAGMTAVLTSQFLQAVSPQKVIEREKTVNHHIRNLNEILPLLKKLEK